MDKIKTESYILFYNVDYGSIMGANPILDIFFLGNHNNNIHIMKRKYFNVFTGTATFLKVYFCKFSCFAHTQKVVAAFLQKKTVQSN